MLYRQITAIPFCSNPPAYPHTLHTHTKNEFGIDLARHSLKAMDTSTVGPQAVEVVLAPDN